MSQTGPRVLVVDDESAVRRFLRTTLTAHDYHVTEAETGQLGILAAAESNPDLIILDMGLPDMDGLDVVKRLREWTKVPIIILSVRDRESDKVEVLDSGADDYVTKPFGISELMARLRVALRHAVQPTAESVFVTGDLEVDLVNRIVGVSGEEVPLTPTEYDLLRTLVTYAGKVLTHRQLLREMRGINYQTEKHILRVHMSNLRRKIEPDSTRPRYILTEPGIGYRLQVDL